MLQFFSAENKILTSNHDVGPVSFSRPHFAFSLACLASQLHRPVQVLEIPKSFLPQGFHTSHFLSPKHSLLTAPNQLPCFAPLTSRPFQAPHLASPCQPSGLCFNVTPSERPFWTTLLLWATP